MYSCLLRVQCSWCLIIYLAYSFKISHILWHWEQDYKMHNPTPSKPRYLNANLYDVNFAKVPWKQYENYTHAVKLCKLWQAIIGWSIPLRIQGPHRMLLCSSGAFRIDRWDYQNSLGKLSSQLVPRSVERAWLSERTALGKRGWAR